MFIKVQTFRTDWFPGSKVDTFNASYKPFKSNFKIPLNGKPKWRSEPKLNSLNEKYFKQKNEEANKSISFENVNVRVNNSVMKRSGLSSKFNFRKEERENDQLVFKVFFFLL